MKQSEQLKEFRGLGTDELKSKVAEMSQEVMNLGFRKSSGQLENPARINTLRRSIARAKTILQEKA